MKIQVSVETLRRAVAEVYNEIETSLSTRGPEKNERPLWWELCCCILSSQVDYPLACVAADAIDHAGVLRLVNRPWEDVEDDLYQILNQPHHVTGRLRRYRFPVAKASQIAKTWMAIRHRSPTLVAFLSSFEDVDTLREWLVRRAPGLGPKQASMFLRNVGITHDFAILDRHVLDYMEIVGLVGRPRMIPVNLRSYEVLELTLRQHALDSGCRLGLLDYAIWVVMRVAKSARFTMETSQ